MQLDPKKLSEMTTVELHSLNNSLTGQRDALRTEQLKIKTELDRRALEDRARQRAASMSPMEQEALQRAIDALRPK